MPYFGNQLKEANDWRTFLQMATGAAFAAAFQLPAAAQVADPRPPTIDVSNPLEIADGVWLLRDHRVWLVPDVAIVLGSDAPLVIDCGLGPANGERVLDLARRLAGSRRLFLTVTHFHPEHGYGALVFRPDATIIYNRTQRDELREKGTRYIELFRKTQSKTAAMALDDTRIVMPHFTYEGAKAELDLGDRKVELHSFGTSYTRGDQIVFLPAERILFAGDLIEERMFPIFPWSPPEDVDIDAARWVSTLESFKALQPKLIVPGHGDPGGIRIALDLASHIREVNRRVAPLRARGATATEIRAACRRGIGDASPHWEHAGLIDWEINYFAAKGM